MPAKKAFGTKLQITISAVLTDIANITNVTPLDKKLAIIDGSSHDSPSEIMEKLPGFKDMGAVKLDLNYDPANTTHQAVEDALGVATAFNIKYPSSPSGRANGAFSGLVAGFTPGAPHDGKLTASVTIEISGGITYT